MGVSRTTFDAATRGLEPDLTLPDLDLPGREGAAAARPGRVRADAGRLRQGGEHRAACRRRRRSSPPSTARRSPRSSRNSACRPTCCSRSGAARPTSAATSCRKNAITRAGDAGLLRPAQGHVPQGVPLALKMLEEGHVTLADMRSSWGGAMGLTQFLPSEFYKYAVDFDGDGKTRHLELGAGCARLRRAAARRQGLAARHALGLRGARAARRRLHHRRAGGHAAARRMAQARLRAGLRRASRARRSSPSRPRCCCRRAPTGRPS